MNNRTFLLSDDILLLINNEESWLKQDEKINQKIFEMIGRAEFQLQELNGQLKAKTFIFDRERKERKFLKEGIESIIYFRVFDIREIEITVQLFLIGETEQSYTISLHPHDKDRFPITKQVVIYLAGLLMLVKRVSSRVSYLINKSGTTRLTVNLEGNPRGIKSFLVEAKKDFNNNFQVIKTNDY